ncbi:Nucleotide-diphospho-sugar transferase family protein [Striga hermonthica]|uniref:Nucleotide-diphospho-sugar transferase family protein n=1 Tax=Striga hermonthica TaxID=68872 RepID=A0A9N7MV23_STRHE|nr:Nucleotide-diphospho-sugar transferase family protein [Striga hermonthica]
MTLEETLRRAAMKDKKTVIITTLNAAWTEPKSILDLFIESFKIGNGTEKLLRHVVVGALDQKAYSRCLQVPFLHCYRLTTQGVDFSGEAFFMSEDYLKLVWRKIDFQREVLELGFDFVFTDADVMWLRDPFERFYPNVDFQLSCDHYWFNSTDRNNSPNSGFSYARSNNRTIQFYNFWYESRERFPGKHDQDALNMLKFDPFVEEIGLGMRFLDTAHFGGFCEPSKDLDLVVTMHANCCIGIGNKIHDINMTINDWKKYASLPYGERNDVLNKIKFDPFIRAIGLQIKFLDTVYFGGFFQPKQGLEPHVHDACKLLCWLGQ